MPKGGSSERDETLALVRQLLARLGSATSSAGSVLPFQFPSLGHLDEAVESALVRAADVEGLAAKSIRGYRSAYRMFRRYLLETRSEDTFLRGHLGAQAQILESWVQWLRHRGANHTTVNSYWRALHAPFARIAQRTGTVNPTTHVATPKPGRPLARFLTAAELDRVFRFVRNYQWPGGLFERARAVAVLATMALGGCRKGEVLQLTAVHVDVDARTIRVRGKGTQGGKSRVVCMTPALHRALEEYLAVRRARDSACDRFFISVRGDQPIGDITIRRLCAFVTRRTGVHVAPHLLRHTCATLLRQGGVPDRLSMEQLGHASLGVLQQYSHIAPGERQRVIGQLAYDPGSDVEAAALPAPATRGIRECSSPTTTVERSTGP